MSEFRDWLHQEYDEVFVLSELEYDKAIIGISYEGRVIYDTDKIIEIGAEHFFESLEQSSEWHHYNTFPAHMQNSPIYLFRPEALDGIND